MLQITRVSHSFDTTHISYPDWKIKSEGQAVILGTSGSGKTTLLHIVSGLLKPTQGEIWMNGTNLGNLSTRKLDNFRGRNIGIVFQKPHLIQSLSIIENIKLAIHLSGKTIALEKIDHVLDSLGLQEIRNRRVHEISEGQAQRVSIARAVIHEPSLLAADEPTASLDDDNCKKVISLLKAEAAEYKAMLIIATHDQRVKDQFGNQLEL